jgi:hypothetical protein
LLLVCMAALSGRADLIKILMPVCVGFILLSLVASHALQLWHSFRLSGGSGTGSNAATWLP